MINQARPICAKIPPNLEAYEHRDLRSQLSETIDTEEQFCCDDDEPNRIVESCCAEWRKVEVDENGEKIMKTELGFTFEVSHYVKCMEPALYWLSIPDAIGGGSYCEFHRPRVRPI